MSGVGEGKGMKSVSGVREWVKSVSGVGEGVGVKFVSGGGKGSGRGEGRYQ